MEKKYLFQVVRDGKVIATEKFFCTKEWMDGFVLKVMECFPNVGKIYVKEL